MQGSGIHAKHGGIAGSTAVLVICCHTWLPVPRFACSIIYVLCIHATTEAGVS